MAALELIRVTTVDEDEPFLELLLVHGLQQADHCFGVDAAKCAVRNLWPIHRSQRVVLNYFF